MRARTAVPGTSNQEEEAGASVAENETKVAALDAEKSVLPWKRNCSGFPTEYCVAH